MLTHGVPGAGRTHRDVSIVLSSSSVALAEGRHKSELQMQLSEYSCMYISMSYQYTKYEFMGPDSAECPV
eukprot:COSAG02_NODE_10_length_59045_cov_19.973365_4_plen_70_part_00